VVFAIALVVQEPSVTLFAILILYAASGPAEWVYRRLAKRPLQRIVDPTEGTIVQG
jgi:hypothetical protein